MKSRDPDKMEPLAAAIYRRMQDRGLTQKRLALQAGLSDTYVRDLFDGKKRSPTPPHRRNDHATLLSRPFA